MGRLCSNLDYTSIKDIIQYGLHEYIDDFQNQLKPGRCCYPARRFHAPWHHVHPAPGAGLHTAASSHNSSTTHVIPFSGLAMSEDATCHAWHYITYPGIPMIARLR